MGTHGPQLRVGLRALITGWIRVCRGLITGLRESHVCLRDCVCVFLIEESHRSLHFIHCVLCEHAWKETRLASPALRKTTGGGERRG